MSNTRKAFAAALGGLALVIVAILLLTAAPATPSYADTVPTPVAAQAGSGSSSWLYVNFLSASAKAASGGTSAFQLPGYDSMDVQYVIDQGTTNTATLTIQWSNDNTNWSDGPALVSNNVADADGMVQVANMGRYTRVYYTLGNTNTITLTVKAIAKY